MGKHVNKQTSYWKSSVSWERPFVRGSLVCTESEEGNGGLAWMWLANYTTTADRLKQAFNYSVIIDTSGQTKPGDTLRCTCVYKHTNTKFCLLSKVLSLEVQSECNASHTLHCSQDCDTHTNKHVNNSLKENISSNRHLQRILAPCYIEETFLTLTKLRLRESWAQVVTCLRHKLLSLPAGPAVGLGAIPYLSYHISHTISLPCSARIP